MDKTQSLQAAARAYSLTAQLALLVKNILHFLPSGGSLPNDVWESRHRFLTGLTYVHALIIALIGPTLGYSWEFSIDALFEDGTVLHTVGEGILVALFAVGATWGSQRRAVKATLVGLGLMSASATFVHLSGGYIELHFHFFVMVAFMALYQDWIPYLLAIVYVAIHHGVIGVIWPQEVYNHTAALNAPWTWAGIHAFFILWSAVGSVIAWRFSEKAIAQTKLILESVGEGILGFNLQGTVSFINPLARRMLGLDQHQKLTSVTDAHRGSAESILSSSELRSSVLAPLRDGVMRQQTNVLIHRADGSSFPADIISNPIIDHGEVTGVVVAFRDVTRRRKAEEALAKNAEDLERSNTELKARYQELQTLHEISETVLDSLDLNVVMQRILDKTFDIGGFDVGVIRVLDHTHNALQPVASRGYRNSENVQRHRRQLEGYTTGVATSRVIEDRAVRVVDLTKAQGNRTLKNEGVCTLIAIPLRSHGDVLGVIQLGNRTAREFREGELRTLDAIGRQAGIAVQKARLYEESQRARVSLAEKADELARSNTKLRVFSEEVKLAKDKIEKVNSILTAQAAELARSNSELEQFAYIASHDLQEPLRMVASYVQLLARRYKGKLDSDADEFIDYAADGAKRMQGLINALLTYSRIGTKGQPLEPTDCEEVLRTTLKNLEFAIKDTGAAIMHDPLPTVMADRTQLGQLFQNLIGNAIKFRDSRRPEVQIAVQRNGAEWEFSFRDNGIGIDPQYKERIFVIFQRLHNKEEYPGTGIGLALCKKIVQRHGGRIWMESKPGDGSVFKFTLPS